MGPYPNVRTSWSSHSNPPACHHARMIRRLTVLCSNPNFVRVWVYLWLRAYRSSPKTPLNSAGRVVRSDQRFKALDRSERMYSPTSATTMMRA